MSHKLLIVEDDLDVREVIVEALSMLNFEIITADNGQQGLEHLKNNTDITAILSDINMPVMNGLEFLENVRKLGFETPFVILSAFGDKNSTVEALRHGAMDFLDKPYQMSNLLKVMTKASELGIYINQVNSHLNELHPQTNLTEEQAIKLREMRMRMSILRFESSKK